MRGESAAPRFEYLPDQQALLEVIVRVAAARVLLVGGDELPNLPVDETRRTDLPGPVMANGVYVLPRAESVDVVVCAGGTAPGMRISASVDDLTDGHPLHAAVGWFDFLWPSAKVVGDGPRFGDGDYVRIAGGSDVARIESTIRVDGRNAYKVNVAGRSRTVGEDGLLPLALDAEDPATWIQEGVASARQLSVSLTVTKLTNPLTDTIYSYLSSKTVFRPYQFRPVLKMLNSAHQRLLIADEVGLGKTIEAGLLWTELEARSERLTRVLVVCPAMLVEKWRAEMRRRFDRDLTILDKKGLEWLVEQLRTGRDDRPILGIVSLERLRSSALLADLHELQARFDLVIVDEAHYLRNRLTLSHELGQALSVWADVLVFLSATPLNLGNNDLFNLLNLLVEDEFADPAVFPLQVEPNRYLNAAASRLLAERDRPEAMIDVLDGVHACQLGGAVTQRAEWAELQKLLSRDRPLDWREVTEAKRLLSELNTLSGVLTRTRKVDVPDSKAVREPVQIDVDWTEAERQLYVAVRAWALARARALGHPPGFATQMPLRQAASCLPAMSALLREREPWLFVGEETALTVDDFDDSVVGEDPGADEDHDLSGISDDEHWLDISRLVARLGDVDTKFDRFASALRELRTWGEGQALVFSFFRRTIAYLERRLREQGWDVRSMHGGVPVAERQRLMDQFRAGEFDILLSSEVGSEGLDFEFCDVVVNYDLPWNPMRVEQRIGRLDRFGQQHEKIFVVNFHVPGTIETDIFERLYARINVFRESIGELEPILRDEVSELQRIVLDPRLNDEQRQRRVDELAVAVEARRLQLEDIKEASAYLAGIDQLLIDGFEEDTTARGRFVGPEELRVLVEEFFADGSRATIRRDGEIWQLLGDDVLADRVSRWGGPGSASLYSLAELVPRLRDEEPIPVTFDNEQASHHNIELISLRHPVVRAALKHFAGRPKGYLRFGSVRLANDQQTGNSRLVVIYMAQTTGLRPSLELWPVAVDLDSGEIDEESGFQLLAALARGDLRDGDPIVAERLGPHLRTIEDYAVRLQLQTEAERRRANEVLVDARIAAQRASFEHKINRAESTLAKVERERRSQSLQRLHRGHIQNLHQRAREAADSASSRRELALTIHPVAAAVVLS